MSASLIINLYNNIHDLELKMSGIQGHPLEVTVVGCYNLDDKEWMSKQDPYVCIEYGSTKFRTRTCKDGGQNPKFKEKFTISLVEGLRELSVMVWDSNTLTADEFIGSGRVQLHKALSQGVDDTTWPIQGSKGSNSGEVRVKLHYSNVGSFNNGNSNDNGIGKDKDKKKVKDKSKSKSKEAPSGGHMNHNMPYASFPPQPAAPYTVPSPHYYPQTYPTIPPAGYPQPPPVGYPPHPSAYYQPGPPNGFYQPSPY